MWINGGGIQVNQVRLELRSHKADWETGRHLVIMRSNEARPGRSRGGFVVRKVQQSRILNISNVSYVKRTSFSCIGALGSGQRL